jgi:hypothetical protein
MLLRAQWVARLASIAPSLARAAAQQEKCRLVVHEIVHVERVLQRGEPFSARRCTSHREGVVAPRSSS